MDYAPLNLAHFHERRANRFLQRHRYDDAYKAVETALIYLQDAFKLALMPKSREVLNTYKWQYERKLEQIQIHKEEHESWKHKEIVPLSDTNTHAALLRTDSNLTAQSIAKSIDKTVREFDIKLNISPIKRTNSRENKALNNYALDSNEGQHTTKPNMLTNAAMTQSQYVRAACDGPAFYISDNDELPSLTPLELPSFEYRSFAASTPTLADLTTNGQKE
ncbi:uncharacterized protein LOC101450818 [Ceratitis capitata]|uniref:(Mediterranean fruit fly) hypothetical protein n=1 Tax=Ceratitis capitata TaxID=7213 RepID=W8C3H7_CERCA|nr:uncharacterized protein LOC101450818 [Ceratitis capitata]CAD7003064.1 unnamed protein product [Ceratitis capitata]